MIYSNMKLLSEKNNRNNPFYLDSEIVLGNVEDWRNSKRIPCSSGLTIEKGMNKDVDFDFDRSTSLIIHRHEEYKVCSDGHYYQAQKPLFLLLTSNISEAKKPKHTYGNGAIKSLNSTKCFRPYFRLDCITSRKDFYTIGIYKLLTKEPCIIKIIPPDLPEPIFLLIRNQNVSEHTEEDPEFVAFLHLLGIQPNDVSKLKWITL